MCIKRNEIIQWLTNESWFLEACYKIAPNKDTAEELYQYAFLAILEKPNKQIEEIYAGGYIRFYVVRLLYNAIHGKCSPFAKHRIFESDEVQEQFSDEESIPYKESQEIKYEAIESTLPKLHWYERKIFEIWMEGNSARAIHRQTKISINEILRVIKKVKQQIRDEYNS